jgi:hypothetical protein
MRVLYEVLQESSIVITESVCSSDNEMNVQISRCGEQCVGSNKEEMSLTTEECSMAYGQSQVR